MQVHATTTVKHKYETIELTLVLDQESDFANIRYLFSCGEAKEYLGQDRCSDILDRLTNARQENL